MGIKKYLQKKREYTMKEKQHLENTLLKEFDIFA